MTDIKKEPKKRKPWIPGEKRLQIRINTSLYDKIEVEALKNLRSRSAEARRRLEESFIEEKA